MVSNPSFLQKSRKSAMIVSVSQKPVLRLVSTSDCYWELPKCHDKVDEVDYVEQITEAARNKWDIADALIMARQPLASLLEDASPGLSQAAARAAPCNTLTWKWDQENSGPSCSLRCCIGRYCLESSLAGTPKDSRFWEILKNGQTRWQRWSQLGCDSAVTTCNYILGCSSCPSPCTLHLIPPLARLSASWFSSRHLSWPGSGKKGKLYHLDLLKKSHGAECHQHTDSTAAKPQLPCEHSAGAVTERIWWDAPLSLLTREKLS